jgi:hypothetical protein
MRLRKEKLDIVDEIEDMEAQISEFEREGDEGRQTC